MRINKLLSVRGIASRRHADEWIKEGKVKVNGVVATLGDDVDENATIEVNGEVIEKKETQFVYYMLNKPKGVLCTLSDDRGRKTVADLLPENAPRVFPVGRLDYQSEGLLLLTNDGELSNHLTHPRNEVKKTYLVKIEGTITEQGLNPIRSGVEIDGKMTKKCKAHIVETNKDYTKIHVVISEGRNREVRKMFEAIGKNVSFLKRIKIGNLELGGLDRGKMRPLTETEIESLKTL